MNEEIWKDIKEYEGLYQVSNLGRIKSLRRYGVKEKYLTGFYDEWGYIRVALSKNGKTKKYKLHRLVAEAFIPNPHNYPQINHDNGIKDDNRTENLEWCTASYNTMHSYVNNLNKTKGKHIKVLNKNNGTENRYRNLRLASISIGHNKGYLSRQILKNKFENDNYKWELIKE